MARPSRFFPGGARASGADGVRAHPGTRVAVGGDHLDRREDRVCGRDAAELGATGRARPPSQVMVGFIDEHREKFGVEPICAVLPIAPSLYYELKARDRDPHRRPGRTRRDEGLCEHVRRVWQENREVYGVRQLWKQLKREGQAVARCTVARLMRRLGLAGVVRGRKFTVTTIPETAAARPRDLVTRQFTAVRPTPLWVADLTYS